MKYIYSCSNIVFYREHFVLFAIFLTSKIPPKILFWIFCPSVRLSLNPVRFKPVKETAMNLHKGPLTRLILNKFSFLIHQETRHSMGQNFETILYKFRLTYIYINTRPITSLSTKLYSRTVTVNFVIGFLVLSPLSIQE